MKDKIQKVIDDKKKDEIKPVSETKQKIDHKLPKKVDDSNSNIGKIKGSSWL